MISYLAYKSPRQIRKHLFLHEERADKQEKNKVPYNVFQKMQMKQKAKLQLNSFTKVLSCRSPEMARDIFSLYFPDLDGIYFQCLQPVFQIWSNWNMSPDIL